MQHNDDIAYFLVHQASVIEPQDLKARKLYEWALSLQPDNLDAVNGLGRVAIQEKQYGEALDKFSYCLDKRPDNTAYLSNMSVALYNLGRLEESLEYCRRVVQLDQWAWMAWHQMGVTHRTLGHYHQSLECARTAVSINPLQGDVRVSYAFSLFALGRWGEAWAEMENRTGRSRIQREMSQFSRAKEWRGESGLSGKTLLVIGEDGLGDQIMFSRWLPILHSVTSATILFAPNPVLAGLLSHIPGIHSAHQTDVDVEQVDYWVGMNSLPHLTKVSIPPAATDLGMYRGPSGSSHLKKLVVGIAWKGDPNTPVDNRRPRDLSLWKPLLALSDKVEFRSLQFNCPAPDGVATFPGAKDMEETARYVGQMDLVITADTAISHLAASIGVPTWMLLYTPPEWRWASGWDESGQHSVWYPAMKVYRQKAMWEWGPVFEQVASDLASLVDRTSRLEAHV